MTLIQVLLTKNNKTIAVVVLVHGYMYGGACIFTAAVRHSGIPYIHKGACGECVWVKTAVTPGWLHTSKTSFSPISLLNTHNSTHLYEQSLLHCKSEECIFAYATAHMDCHVIHL